MASDLIFSVGADTGQAENDIKGLAGSLVGPLGKVALAATAAATALAGVILKESIESASAYETAVNGLNMALAASGEFSRDASDGFREWASTLQNTTKFSDDQVISTASLIQNLGKLSESGLKEATKAALDLSAALNIDLNTASTLIGKATNGNIAAFARYGIQIRKGKDDTETFANTLKTLKTSFPDAAEAAARTFSGASAQLKNSFDDIFKEIGRAVVKSPSIIAIITEFQKIFTALSEWIKRSIGSTDIFKPLLSNLITVAAVITSIFMPLFEALGRTVGIAWDLIMTGLRTMWTGLLGVGAVIEKILNSLGLSSSTFFADETAKSFDKLTISANETANNAVASFGNQGTVTTAILDGMASMQGAVDTTTGKLKEFSDGVTNIPPEFEIVKTSITDLNTSFQEGLWPTFDITKMKQEEISKKSIETKDSMTKAFKQIGESARQGIGSAVGGGFAAFGKALASGENAVKAFANAFLGAIGGMLVQLGTSYILQGIAASANPLTPGIGGPLIAAGAALATFGGVLQAIGGGGGSKAESGGGGGGSGGSISPTTASPDELTNLNERKANTGLVVNIQGNILDRRQTGLEIAEVIQETFGSNGINFQTA